MAPEWEAAAAVLKNAPIPVKLAKVDATIEGDLAKRFSAEGYPTLKVRKPKQMPLSTSTSEMELQRVQGKSVALPR